MEKMPLIDQQEAAKLIRQNKDTHEDCQGAIHYNIGCEHSAQIVEKMKGQEDYKKAFSVACELLIGASLFGVTEETMFKEIMDKEGIVSSLGYEKYILENLARLTGEDDGTD